MSSVNRRARKTYKAPARRNRRMGYPSMGGKRKSNPSSEKQQTGARAPMFLCSVPYEKCSGTPNQPESTRFHASPGSVLACKGSYLVKQGYTKKSMNEYIDPKDGRILVLTKKPGRVKPGKSAGLYMGRPLKVKLW